MYSLELVGHVSKLFKKIKVKDKNHFKAIGKKILQILDNPYHFKRLKKPMQHLRRTHIMKSFVLIYKIDEKNKKVIIIDYNHHDKIYNI
ncbi:type II toxin-antitoxin system RelE/ParE family toxin [Candidatus Micrarchaeota archaeon]|nr:type II toxin-antitoxin system RelE/ParE family toxin [Candidatus Micrarchaeota archaeon]